MVEHRSPKPSMGVRIPHPLERRSPADVMSAGLFCIALESVTDKEFVILNSYNDYII